jgi:hypothetical protein
MRLRTLLSVCGFTLCLAATVAGQQESSGLSQNENANIPAGARVYIGPIESGYDIYLAAAIHKKEVPIVIVTDKSKADFELSGVTESDKAAWAKIVFWGNTSSAEQASVKVVNLKSSSVVWGYNVNKGSSARGKQSSAEACAKHLKEKIEKGK